MEYVTGTGRAFVDYALKPVVNGLGHGAKYACKHKREVGEGAGAFVSGGIGYGLGKRQGRIVTENKVKGVFKDKWMEKAGGFEPSLKESISTVKANSFALGREKLEKYEGGIKTALKVGDNDEVPNDWQTQITNACEQERKLRELFTNGYPQDWNARYTKNYVAVKTLFEENHPGYENDMSDVVKTELARRDSEVTKLVDEGWNAQTLKVLGVFGHTGSAVPRQDLEKTAQSLRKNFVLQTALRAEQSDHAETKRTLATLKTAVEEKVLNEEDVKELDADPGKWSGQIEAATHEEGKD